MVFVDCRGVQAPRAVGGPLAKVCGLPILVRTLLILERAGCERAYLLVEPGHRVTVEGVLARHSRLHMPFAIVESTGDSLAPLAKVLGERSPDAQVLVWPAALSLGRRAPEWCEVPAGGMLLGQDVTSGQDSGLVLSTARVLCAHPEQSVAELVKRLAAEGKLERVPLPGRVFTVVDRATVRLAERELLRSLRKDADGAVAKFDRYVSLAISRPLMALPIKPNHITAVAVLIGILCGVLVAHGGYAWMLLGAAAFQLNSILDGVDGEIARAKLLESPSGQWLDTVSDDLSNLAFMVGVSVGSYRTWGSLMYLALGAIAGVSLVISDVIMYHYLITRTHTGDLNDFVLPWHQGRAHRQDRSEQPKGLISRVVGKLEWVFRRDAYVFMSTLFGVAGQLRFMTWLFAAGTTVFWVSILLGRALLSPLTGGSEGA
jgi:phosphatidylglycerophosphate synthase